MITAQDFVNNARSWIGTPWVHQGRTRKGVDCVGFVECLGLQSGVLPASYSFQRSYARSPPASALHDAVADIAEPLDSAVKGCLIILKMPYVARHLGICAGETMIHSVQPVGVVEIGYRHPFPKRSVSFWAVRGVSYE